MVVTPWLTYIIVKHRDTYLVGEPAPGAVELISGVSILHATHSRFWFPPAVLEKRNMGKSGQAVSGAVFFL